jgi:hypothetical protein
MVDGGQDVDERELSKNSYPANSGYIDIIGDNYLFLIENYKRRKE